MPPSPSSGITRPASDLEGWPSPDGSILLRIGYRAGFHHRYWPSGCGSSAVGIGRERRRPRQGGASVGSELEMLNAQIMTFNRRIGELLNQHPDSAIFTSFPEVGRITAAELLVEIGEDRSRCPTVWVLLAEVGAAPATFSSGKVCQVRILCACNKRLRSTAISWANTLRRIDPISGGAISDLSREARQVVGRWEPSHRLGSRFSGDAGKTAGKATASTVTDPPKETTNPEVRGAPTSTGPQRVLPQEGLRLSRDLRRRRRRRGHGGPARPQAEVIVLQGDNYRLRDPAKEVLLPDRH
jgi:hypothetical protein